MDEPNITAAYGVAYARAYQRTYRDQRDKTQRARVGERQRLVEAKQAEPVGTAEWHALVGSLTALAVLMGPEA